MPAKAVYAMDSRTKMIVVGDDENAALFAAVAREEQPDIAVGIVEQNVAPIVSIDTQANRFELGDFDRLRS